MRITLNSAGCGGSGLSRADLQAKTPRRPVVITVREHGVRTRPMFLPGGYDLIGTACGYGRSGGHRHAFSPPPLQREWVGVRCGHPPSLPPGVITPPLHCYLDESCIGLYQSARGKPMTSSQYLRDPGEQTRCRRIPDEGSTVVKPSPYQQESSKVASVGWIVPPS